MSDTLQSLLRTLPDLPRHAEVELDYEMRQQAGVSMILREGAPLDVLFIKRAQNPRDPWAGHMALPGGRRELSDRDLLDTAIRETREETTIELAHHHLVGRMPLVAPKGPKLPRVAVIPFLFGVSPNFEAVGEPGEVEAIRWVPVDHLLNPANREDYVVEMPAGRRTFPGIRFNEDIIWGMTYRIVEDFLLLASGQRPHGI